ncbi:MULTISPECIES: GNAT family N-acetyltransferase [Streptomyces]|uniref:GNAT family N-acetyltransferase n=1 Tax=Streptomyces TaxID=1883 RepID=UPI00073DCC2F|nr:GNAT family N-acetyltransferase [Streptomyces sp. EAS-AB2608]BCM66407.1 putative acetyltransferase [Streptomyces sp. EAS-AB2608]CUW27994.1 Putative phosphinothricin acetyltransferase YwnH [Streptomyces reticuli]
MPEPSIRIAQAADERELAVLDRATWSTLHAVTPRPEPPYQPFFDERHPPREFLVAEADGRILGYIRLTRPTPLASNAHVLAVQGFAVADEARGRGIGRALVRAAVAEARRRGARRLTLRVLAHNTPARSLYEAEGFAVEGVLPGEFLIDGRYVDDVCMGRSL